MSIAKLQEENEALKKRCEEEQKRASEAVEELEKLVYILSHDLRSPLNHITGFAGLLAESTQEKLNDEEKYYIETIIESSERLGNLLNSLLTYSRLIRAEMYQMEVALNLLIDEIRLHQNIEKIAWKVDELPSVCGDPVMLRQAITYLIENAVKFARSVPQPMIEISHEKQMDTEREIVFSIKDNGIGFAPEYAEEIFQVFKKLHHDDEYEGVGMGLANLKRIIQRHGGKVWAESELGQGARFYVKLPKCLEEKEK